MALVVNEVSWVERQHKTWPKHVSTYTYANVPYGDSIAKTRASQQKLFIKYKTRQKGSKKRRRREGTARSEGDDRWNGGNLVNSQEEKEQYETTWANLTDKH